MGTLPIVAHKALAEKWHGRERRTSALNNFMRIFEQTRWGRIRATVRHPFVAVAFAGEVVKLPPDTVVYSKTSLSESERDFKWTRAWAHSLLGGEAFLLSFAVLHGIIASVDAAFYGLTHNFFWELGGIPNILAREAVSLATTVFATLGILSFKKRQREKEGGKLRE